MKAKVTRKKMKEQNCVAVNYADLDYLLHPRSPIYYSAGVNGWQCDYYLTSHGFISTGYDPVGRKISYERVRWYNQQAKNAGKRKLEKLFDKFCEEFGV